MNEKRDPLLVLLDQPSYIAIPGIVCLLFAVAFLFIFICFLLGSAASYINQALELGIPLGF